MTFKLSEAEPFVWLCSVSSWCTPGKDIYIHKCACVRTSVTGCPEARRSVPVDLNVTKRGHIVVLLSYVSQGRGGATITRLRSLEQPARPGLRRTAVASSSWAATSMHMQCRAKQTASWMSRQTQVNNCDVAATASPRQTSVAFAAVRKQNAAQRSDHQSEPLHANTPVSRARPSPPASWCGSRDY